MGDITIPVNGGDMPVFAAVPEGRAPWPGVVVLHDVGGLKEDIRNQGRLRVQREDHLYGRAQRDISLVNAPNGSSLPEDKLQTINHPANYLLALQHLFTPTLFNEAKVYINRSPFHNPQASALPFAVNTSDFIALTTTRPTLRSALV